MHQVCDLEGSMALQTRKEWNSQIESFEEDEDILLASEYEARLDHALSHENSPSGRGFYYGLKEESGDYAKALLEVTYKRLNASPSELKLLDMHLEPRLDIRSRGAAKVNLNEALDIVSAGIVGALDFTGTRHPAGKLKAFGRGKYMGAFFETVAESLLTDVEFAENYDVDVSGKWLMIEEL